MRLRKRDLLLGTIMGILFFGITLICIGNASASITDYFRGIHARKIRYDTSANRYNLLGIERITPKH